MSSATAGIGNREDGVPPDRGSEDVTLDDSGGDIASTTGRQVNCTVAS